MVHGRIVRIRSRRIIEREGEGIGAYVQFAKGSKVQAKVSTSYISPE